MIFSLAYNILYATIIPVSEPLIILSALFLLVIFAIVFNNHYTFLITLGFIGAAALLLFARWDESWLSKTDTAGMAAYLRDLILFVRGYLPYKDSYGPIITCCVCAFLALYMTLSLYVTFQFYFASLLGIGVFAVNWLMDYKRSEISFIIFVFCFCVLLYKKLNKKNADVNRTAILMTPVFILVIACANYLPAANKGWDNSKVIEHFREPLNRANDFFYFIFNPKYFSFQTTGFEGGGGRLGGSLALNNREIMRVTADSPVYLAGLIKDAYTGNAWLNSSEGFTLPYSEDGALSEALETRLNVPDQPLQWVFGSYAEKIVTYKHMTVNIGSARTGTIFRPLKNNGVSINTELTLLTDNFGDMRLSDVLAANAEYNFEYMDIDYSAPVIQNILRQCHRGFYREGLDNDMYVSLLTSANGARNGGQAQAGLTDAFNEQNLPNQRFIWAMWEYQNRSHPGVMKLDPLGYFRDKLIPYAGYVYDTFLGIPETTPQRVRDLALQLTAGADNDYDRAKAIESYLIKIPYTLTPDPVPQNRDFVDYFLFDGKEGYCTYYASAMAVMCRAIGLPARYIEGYVMPPEKTDGVYQITNLQAHAWPEVYFEGFGWVPFEPTAPYSYGYYQTTPAPNLQIFSPDFASNPYYEDYMRNIMGGMGAVPPVQNVPAAAQTQKEKLMNFLASALMAAAALLFIAASFGAMVIWGQFGIWRRQKYIRRLPRNGQAIEYFHDIIKMTRYYRYPMRENETPAMYAGRIGKRFAFKNDTVFIRDLAVIYNRAKYGGVQIRRDELSLMKACREELLEFLRYIKRKPVFIWNRYITRRI